MELLVEQEHTNLFQCRTGSEHLRDDLGTVSLFLDHALKTPYLALDPFQSIEDLLVGWLYWVTDHVSPLGLDKRCQI
jgi:hypothetical protein